MSENKSNRGRAIAALKKAAGKKAKPHTKKLARKALKELGADNKTVAKALYLADMARKGKVKGKVRLGENTSLEGELDAKKKSISARLKHSF